MLVEKSLLLFGLSAIAVIIFAIVIVAAVQNSFSPPIQSFSQITSYGPVWKTDSWQCTSNSDYMIHGLIRGFKDAQYAIKISNIGTQSFYTFGYQGQSDSFSIGVEAGQTFTITRTGTVSGFLTLQTNTGATANCDSI